MALALTLVLALVLALALVRTRTRVATPPSAGKLVNSPASRREKSRAAVVSNTATTPMDLKNPVRRFAASRAESPAACARDARDCGATDTTVTLRPPDCAHAATCCLNSSTLCASRSTVSADVMQPLHARQSERETLMASLSFFFSIPHWPMGFSGCPKRYVRSSVAGAFERLLRIISPPAGTSMSSSRFSLPSLFAADRGEGRMDGSGQSARGSSIGRSGGGSGREGTLQIRSGRGDAHPERDDARCDGLVKSLRS